VSLGADLAAIGAGLIEDFGVEGLLIDATGQSHPVNFVWSSITLNDLSNGDIKWSDKKIILDGSQVIDLDYTFLFEGITYQIINATPSLLENTLVTTMVVLRKYQPSLVLTVSLYSWNDNSSTDGFTDTPLTLIGAVAAAQAEVTPHDQKLAAAARTLEARNVDTLAVKIDLSKVLSVFIFDGNDLTGVKRAFVLYNGGLYAEMARAGTRLICETADRTAYGV